MRVLLDTNVVVSALLFGGAPRELLRILSGLPFELWTSRPLLRELAATLSHERLRSAVDRVGVSVERLVKAYARQATIVPDAQLPMVVFSPDPGDAPVIAAAQAARVHWLVSGDRHLLGAGEQLTCEVLTVREALERAKTIR